MRFLKIFSLCLGLVCLGAAAIIVVVMCEWWLMETFGFEAGAAATLALLALVLAAVIAYETKEQNHG